MPFLWGLAYCLERRAGRAKGCSNYGCAFLYLELSFLASSIAFLLTYSAAAFCGITDKVIAVADDRYL